MPRRPNILFINVDQQRFDCLGFTGNPIVKTPNLDALAAGGLQFTSAFTPLPSCCPSRQTLLGGQMPCTHGGHWNYDAGSNFTAPQLAERSWTRLLRQRGYRMAYFGKWHVHPELDPTAFGFETFDELEQQPAAKEKHAADNPWPMFPVGHFDDRPLEKTHTHRLAAACITKIEEFAETGEPWHIRLDFKEPHLPCVPAEPFASMYPPETIPPWPNFGDSFENKPFIQRQQVHNWGIEKWTWHEWSVYMSGYYGIISQYDDAVGKVLRRLGELGLTEDTLIIYTADHGDAAGSHRMMDKHYVMYEEEVHIPLVISWKGKITPGKCPDFVSHYLDLPPTLLELTGIPVPPDYQGCSFLPQLQNKEPARKRDYIFSEYNGQQFGLFTQRMVRDRKYKFVWNATDTDELYDLENDPHEMRNLAAAPENNGLCREYSAKVYETFSGLGDRMVRNPWLERWLAG